TLFFFFLYCVGLLRALHSFPTRRSSDLGAAGRGGCLAGDAGAKHGALAALLVGLYLRGPWGHPMFRIPCRSASPSSTLRAPSARSEEHTSELQSRENLVCRLLLEKKKKN